MLTKIFCCDIFTELLNSAGEKGYSVIPSEYQGTYKFFLQSRSIDNKDLENNRSIVVQRAINYCPWCGCNLSKVAMDNIEDISKLAKKNSYLFI